MSQIDILNFFPHLFWFFSAWLVLYGLIFSFISPMVYESVKFRSLYFSYLYRMTVAQNNFLHFLYYSFQLNFLHTLQQLAKKLILSVYLKLWKNSSR